MHVVYFHSFSKTIQDFTRNISIVLTTYMSQKKLTYVLFKKQNISLLNNILDSVMDSIGASHLCINSELRLLFCSPCVCVGFLHSIRFFFPSPKNILKGLLGTLIM